MGRTFTSSFAGAHASGVNVVLADGSVRFIPDNIPMPHFSGIERSARATSGETLFPE